MNECPRCGRLESHTEICALQGEIERLRHDIERHIAMASDLATENERLREYARHKPCCPNGIFPTASCDCGYDELIAELEDGK